MRWSFPGSRQRQRSGDRRRCVSSVVERGERRRPESREPRGSRAAAEARIIHSPNFDGPVVPHLCFGRDPAIGAIGIAIESQNVDWGCPRCSQLGSSRPDFQFAAFKWNRLAHRLAPHQCGRRREQDEPVWKRREGNHCKIQNRNHKDDAPPEQRFSFPGFHVCVGKLLR